MFFSPGLVFGGTEVVVSCFHVLLFRTRFQRYRGGRVPFSYFALLDRFWAVSCAPGPVFMFCAPEPVSLGIEIADPVFMFCTLGLVLGGTVGAGSRFNVLRSRSRFGLYRGSWVPVSCFALPDTF
jgi:hypothetical protein